MYFALYLLAEPHIVIRGGFGADSIGLGIVLEHGHVSVDPATSAQIAPDMTALAFSPLSFAF